MSAPGKLAVDAEGRVHGANVTWNSQWPCGNGDSGGMAVPTGVSGMLVHTQVGNNPGSIAWFNNSASQASAHFCVAQDGSIVQMGPVNGWMAWHCAAGNPNWFGCEFADNGQPSNPLTQAQVTAGAQLLELLSRPEAGRFPMQITDSPATEGLGWHGMGGAAFGGHYDCPGDVRKAQRPQIVALAVAIRSGTAPPSSTGTTGWQEAIMNALPTLQQGSADHAGAVMFVHRAQALVKVIGQVNSIPAAASLLVDGNFTQPTAAAVKAVQGFFGITADSIVGPVTWTHLIAG